MPATEPETPFPVRIIPVPTDQSDDGVVEGLSYQRYNEDSSNNDNDIDHDTDTGAMALACNEAWASSRRFAAFQDRYLGPISPERAPAFWMVLNFFCLAWSFALGVYLTLLYYSYRDEIVASREMTTDYLVYTLLTTLVWVAEISLRAAFPALDTILVVSTPTPSFDSDDDEEVAHVDFVVGGGGGVTIHNTPTTIHKNTIPNNDGQQQQLFRNYTTEESVVTLETVVQKRSKKHTAVIATELLLAVFFGVETILECWKHWNYHHGGGDAVDNDSNNNEYYDYDDGSGDDVYYPMIEQQLDIWVNVLAYFYMTHHTYKEYYRSKTMKVDIHRSLSTTLLHQLQKKQQRPHQSQSQPQPQPQAPYFNVTADPYESPNATMRTTITRSVLEQPLPLVGTNTVVSSTSRNATERVTATPVHAPLPSSYANEGEFVYQQQQPPLLPPVPPPVVLMPMPPPMPPPIETPMPPPMPPTTTTSPDRNETER